MSVYFFNSLSDDEHLNLLIVADFFNSLSSGKTSLPFKNSCLPTFPGNKAEILAVCLSKFY